VRTPVEHRSRHARASGRDGLHRPLRLGEELECARSAVIVDPERIQDHIDNADTAVGTENDNGIETADLRTTGYVLSTVSNPT
jgi:hypothetical protein